MKHRIVILPQAERDVQRNADWWAKRHSTQQAIDWLNAVQSQLQTIAEAPESCSLSFENEEFSYELREKLVGLGARPRYRAVFTVVENTVYLLTIRAVEQDRLTEDQISFDRPD